MVESLIPDEVIQHLQARISSPRKNMVLSEDGQPQRNCLTILSESIESTVDGHMVIVKLESHGISGCVLEYNTFYRKTVVTCAVTVQQNQIPFLFCP